MQVNSRVSDCELEVLPVPRDPEEQGDENTCSARKRRRDLGDFWESPV